MPIQVWASKSFVHRWLGHAPDLGLDASLKDDGRQLSGTITNRLKGSAPQTKDGITLSHCFLVYEDWAYEIGTLRPGESVEIGPRRGDQLEYLHERRVDRTFRKALPRNRKTAPTTAAVATWPTCCRR